MANKSDVTFEIIQKIGIIRENSSSGWHKELNLISWNGSDPKYDIREWSPDHTHMSRGITLTADEMQTIVDVYRDYLKH